MSCGVGCRHSSYPALLELWGRLAAAALIQPLAWELPYATHAVLKTNKQTKQIKRVQTVNVFSPTYEFLNTCSFPTLLYYKNIVHTVHITYKIYVNRPC